MEQSVQELCWLLQEVLFEKMHDFKITDSERLYHIAKENGLSGTVFEVLQNHRITEDAYNSFRRDFYKYVAQDEEQLRTIELIKGLLNANNIKHVFLKGSMLKQLYPKSYMRAMGDIDFLVKQKDKSTIQELFERLDIRLKSKNFVHDVYETSSKMDVEVHSRLTRTENEYPVLDDIGDIVKRNVFEPALEIVYLLYHLKKHLITGGIGLRSVIDIGVYVYHVEDQVDFTRLEQLLKQSNLLVLYENVMSFNSIYLDVSFGHVGAKKERDEDLFTAFTQYIVASGIHGLGISFNRFSGIVASNHKKSFTRLSSLLKLVFVPYKSIKYIYPRLLKYRIFLPIAWLLRIFDLLFLHRKRRVYRLKELYNSKELIASTNNMFKKLGL